MTESRQPEARGGPEAVLDLGIELTFPASDPISVQEAFSSAHELEQARKASEEESDS